MKIDLHTHILPRTWADLDAKYGYRGFVRLEHHRPCCARMMIGERFFREIGDKSGIAYALCKMGALALARGEVARANDLHGQSLRLSWELRDKRRIALGRGRRRSLR